MGSLRVRVSHVAEKLVAGIGRVVAMVESQQVDDVNSTADRTTGQSTALVLGCGYVGMPLARLLLEKGQRVFASTRQASKAKKLAEMGAQPVMFDATQPLTHTALQPVLKANQLHVYWLLPPGRPTEAQPDMPKRVLIDGAASLMKTLGHATDLRRAIWVSSTAVYGDHQGEKVTAQTPCRPDSVRAQLLLDAENKWLSVGACYRVVRFAGLYGPGRVPGQKALQAGAPLLGDPQAWMNLLHQEDAVNVLWQLAQSTTAQRVELAADGKPIRRQMYYAQLAKALGVPDPEIVPAEKAALTLGLDVKRLQRTSSKALDPQATYQRLSFQPRYPDAMAWIKQNVSV